MDVLQTGSGFTCPTGSSSLERLQLPWGPPCRLQSSVVTASSWQVRALGPLRVRAPSLNAGDCTSSRDWQRCAADQHNFNFSFFSSDKRASSSSGEKSTAEGQEESLLTVVTENGTRELPLTTEDSSCSSEFVGLAVEKIGRNKRRIRANIAIGAPLEAVWGILTSYDKLAEFIPGLAVSQLVKRGNGRAVLRQVGQENIAFGIMFKAEALLEVTEHPAVISKGVSRQLDFEMVKGDFELFSGTWEMVQKKGQAPRTTLVYTVVVQPKPWLPVGLLEERLSQNIKLNLLCVRDAAVSRAARA